MYLLMILLIAIVVPFLVMPRRISQGSRNPYDVVLISVITICAAAAVIFMGAAMVGEGVMGLRCIMYLSHQRTRSYMMYPTRAIRIRC